MLYRTPWICFRTNLSPLEQLEWTGAHLIEFEFGRFKRFSNEKERTVKWEEMKYGSDDERREDGADAENGCGERDSAGAEVVR